MEEPTIYVPTLGRVGDQRMLEGLKAAKSPLLKKITLIVTHGEAKEHKKQWYATAVKKLQVLPPEIDCIAKKRKWMAHNCQTESFYMFDDDIAFLVWSVKEDNFVRHSAVKNQEKLTTYFLEYLPSLLAEHAYVTFGGRFMAKPTIKSSGFLTSNSGYCAVLFDTKKARAMEYNRMMFYNDADALLQLLTMTGIAPAQDLHVLTEKKNTKKNDNTGADVYRTQFLVNDSLTKLVRYQCGRVMGMKDDNSHSIQNRVTISYRNAREWNSYSSKKKADLSVKSEIGLKEMMKKFGLSSPPKLLPFEDSTPRAEIVQQLTLEWKRATKRTQEVTGLFA